MVNMLDNQLREKVLTFLEREITAANIPGACISVSRNSQMIVKECIGSRTLHPSPQPVEEATIYDLASLTKVVATLPALLKLLGEGAFHLKDRVSYFLPRFGNNGKEEIRIEHLLTHTSGLAAHRRFYLENITKGQIIERICADTLVEEPGKRVIYSDLGFILLARIIEEISQQSFESFVDQYIFKPLDMKETGFNLSLPKERFAATVYSDELHDFKYGIVHDENAEAIGGVSGHAGLFSTLNDLTKFASMIENEGAYNQKGILDKSVLDLARTNFTPYDREGRGLGWQLQSEGALASGDLLSRQTYGHTGYTGTSIWFDPLSKITVILLTNRVHAKNQNGILRLRPRLHNLIHSHLSAKGVREQ